MQNEFNDLEQLFSFVETERQKFSKKEDLPLENYISQQHYKKASEIFAEVVKKEAPRKASLTKKIDAIVLHRIFGPLILLAIIYLLYELSIVYGYKLTNYTWPYLASFKTWVISLLPNEGLLFDPVLRSLVISVLDGVLAVINYIPIFFIMFTLIAILEDVGYIPRMTFIMDRVARRFGLHGQSIFPLVLSGFFVGGCAVPGVMATRGIKDEKARLSTILIAPIMNCLAKTPLYILLISIFFPKHQGFAMFFIATVNIFLALGLSKLFSLTILKNKPSAPFVMEMPSYHIPTIQGVLTRSFERIWGFIKKVTTLVMAVMVVVFFLINFPGINTQQKNDYLNTINSAKANFYDEIKNYSFYNELLGNDYSLTEFINYYDKFNLAKISSDPNKIEQIHEKFAKTNLAYYKVANRGRYKDQGSWENDIEARQVFNAFNSFYNTRRIIRSEIDDINLHQSVLGKIGQKLEPLTKYAGFDWKINIALISSLAAKENSVATLGSIYQSSSPDENLEHRMAEDNKTPLHALAIMVFMALYPPCIPTLIAVYQESGSFKWMLFALFYPIIIGFISAVIIFSGGTLLGLTGLQAMIAFYALSIVFMTIMALINPPQDDFEF